MLLRLLRNLFQVFGNLLIHPRDSQATFMSPIVFAGMQCQTSYFVSLEPSAKSIKFNPSFYTLTNILLSENVYYKSSNNSNIRKIPVLNDFNYLPICYKWDFFLCLSFSFTSVYDHCLPMLHIDSS